MMCVWYESWSSVSDRATKCACAQYVGAKAYINCVL
jgi:hypothetical protein